MSTPALITCFIVVSVIAAALLSLTMDAGFRFQYRVNQRLRTSWRSRSEERSSLFSETHLADEEGIRTWVYRAARLFDQAELRLSRSAYLTLTAVASLVSAVAVVWHTGQGWLAACLVLVVWATAIGYLVVRGKRRAKRILHQLPRALDVVARAVQAGQTVPAAFQMVADDLEPPIAHEFRRCHEQQSLGVSFETSLRNLGRRTGIMELRILIIALLVQRRSGGNLAVLMRNLSSLVQKRLKLEQRVRALTAEGRMQATVLMVLPPAAFAVLYVLQPGYVQVLIERPTLLAVAAGAQALGAIWIRRCIRIPA